MNVFVVLVLALVLPSTYLAREVGKQDVSSARNSFVFPKDRKTSPDARIIGGQEVTPHSYPFQVALLIYTRAEVYFCGGSLITEGAVLTAAHCVTPRPNPALYILATLGAHDISVTEDNAEIFNSTSWVFHNDWNEGLLQNDVAIVKLPTEVILNDYIQTISYASGTNKYEQAASVVVGWGLTENSTTISSVLRSLNTTIISNAVCAAADPALDALLVDTHICITGQGTTGACSGDSGGPLIVDGVQVGIVSFGFTNCLLSMPSVFTRVTEFSDWIRVNGASSYENLYYSLIVSLVLSIVHFFKNM